MTPNRIIKLIKIINSGKSTSMTQPFFLFGLISAATDDRSIGPEAPGRGGFQSPNARVVIENPARRFDRFGLGVKKVIGNAFVAVPFDDLPSIIRAGHKYRGYVSRCFGHVHTLNAKVYFRVILFLNESTCLPLPFISECMYI